MCLFPPHRVRTYVPPAVYNEQIYDLIGPNAAERQPLAVREDAKQGKVQVSGLSEVEVQGTAQVLDLLRLGNRNRKTESTAANQVSSRSHAVLQVGFSFAFAGCAYLGGAILASWLFSVEHPSTHDARTPRLSCLQPFSSARTLPFR